MGLNLLGGSLIFIGYRDHYLVQKVQSPLTIENTYYALAYTVIIFPATLILVKKLCNRFIIVKSFHSFIKEKPSYSNSVVIRRTTLMLMAVCTIATIYVFVNLGYVPFVELFRGERINELRLLGSRFFQGNHFIKNILMLSLTSYLSYFTYINFRIMKTRIWRAMFAYMACLSVIVLTYDFSKAPIIFFVLGIYLIEVCLGNVRNIRYFSLLITISIVIILSFYLFIAEIGDSIFSIYSGPLGRLLFTQIATLFLHFEVFPSMNGFLYGASFNSWMSFIVPEAQSLRSGRVVMTIFNYDAVLDKTAGVMNTLFIGEAYANFGYVGVILAPIIFGIVIGLSAYLLQSMEKSSVSIFLYVQLTLHFAKIIEGGFIDIIYSASTIILVMFSLLLNFVSNKGRLSIQFKRFSTIRQFNDKK